MRRRHPRVLGVDDAPFKKRQEEPVPIVGVVMEGALLVEAVAITRFPVDGEGATEFLADWIRGLRAHTALQAVVLGGITIAGLGLVELAELARRVETPVISVTRRGTETSRLAAAFETAGFPERIELLTRTPPSHKIEDGLWVAFAGTHAEDAKAIVRATLKNSKMPEPLRVAHLIGAALVSGESRGRV